jgi:hypothetical protein
MFGWPEPADAGAMVPSWRAAEQATDVAMAQAFAHLDEKESDELVPSSSLLRHTMAAWSDDPENPELIPQPVPGAKADHQF